MINPFHMYLARRPSTRNASEAKAPTTTSTKQSDTGNASKNSSVDSKSQQSSYYGGDSLSPTSTASTDHAAKMSMAGSSTSSTQATALQHKLPEFEHFRGSPLMPEFYPRTSEFFSQGRRRSSVAVHSDTSAGSGMVGAAPAIPEAMSSNGAKASAKGPDAFNLPLTFQEEEALQGEQLPVRLGLAPPSHLNATGATYKARVGYGYYFCVPPPEPPAPAPAPEPTPRPSISTKPSLRRRNTDNMDTLGLPQAKGPTSGSSNSSPISPGASSSTSRTQTNSSTTSVHGHALPGRSSSTRRERVRLPPASPDCWHPDTYFKVMRSRVKGKMREHKYHAFPSSVVPYWHGYNTEAFEAEVSTHLNVNAAMRGKNTMRDYPEGARPRRALDLGCGRGVWCLDVAKSWKTTEFVGLDIVPIQPPLEQLGDEDLEQRVSWVVANFLDPLPFPDASFDYVHVRFILQGVPEDKWADIFSEARRVLAPGGVLEVMEGNHVFFGHASLVDKEELKNLEDGKAANSTHRGSSAKLPKRLKVLNDSSDSSDIDAIEVIMERMMHRRFINPTPLSVVPSALLLPGFASVANGNPRHIPVYAESKAQRERASAAAGSPNPDNPSSEDEEKRQGKYTSRGQIGKPLNSQFVMADADLFCAFVILQQLDHFSSSRELIWAESEEEKRLLLSQGVAPSEVAKMDTSRRFGQGNPAALKPFAHPWKSKDQFFRALDSWIDATRSSADTEYMLRRYLGWEQAHEDLTVEGRKYAERRRKMSTSSAAMPSLGLESLSLEPAVEEIGESSWDSQATKETGTASRDTEVSAANDGPARLQSRRRSVSHILTSQDSTFSTGADKKKKKLKRPSSSGSGGSSSAARTRTFGRGGAGGGPPLPAVPLPEAPAFMASHAFGSQATDPQNIFRGPAQKARMEGGGRGGLSARKSISGRSSSSGPSERSPEVLASPPPPPVPQKERDISPAAAYAATQRVSHGIEEEFRMQGDGTPSSGSRPASPTTAIAGQSLGSRPSVQVQHGSGEARSVSMPATQGVRIAEPLSRPSRAKSNDKAVAMIGFYDCTGYIATV